MCIRDRKDKCPENAPSCATYLRILAERSADKALVEYIVYPGENNTSDFNVDVYKRQIRDMNGKFQRILQDRIGNNIYSLTQRTSPLPFPPSKFVHPLLISNLK